jgi:prepilin-type N-terminal cleavage/methylation domain-containing protein
MARRPAPAVAKQRGGFTLLELVIAIAITVVLGALTLPSYNSLLSRQRLLATARDLQADIAFAREEAGRRGQAVYLVFQPGAQWCYAIGSQATADCQGTAVLAGGPVIKVVRATDHPGTVLSQASTMALDGRNGTRLLGAGQASFASPHGLQLQVRLGPLGRSAVCAPGAPVSGLPACPPTATPG